MRMTTIIALACLAAAFAPLAPAANLGYDPQADPFDQYHAAIAEANAQGKLVLVVAGGDWCRWCHVLERFIERNADVRTNLEDAFVVVKVYVGGDNYNEDFFAQLPKAIGAPHFWVISPERIVLASQSTGSLERGKNGYDKAQFLSFIEHWKDHSSHGHSLAAAP